MTSWFTCCSSVREKTDYGALSEDGPLQNEAVDSTSEKEEEEEEDQDANNLRRRERPQANGVGGGTALGGLLGQAAAERPASRRRLVQDEEEEEVTWPVVQGDARREHPLLESLRGAGSAPPVAFTRPASVSSSPLAGRDLSGEDCVLHVHVVEAKRVAAADSNGYSDPFCKVKVAGQKEKTSVINKTLNPVWNEAFTFELAGGDFSQNLVVEVFDKDTLMKNDFLGSVSVPLGPLAVVHHVSGWFDLMDEALQERTSGAIYLHVVVDTRERAANESGASDKMKTSSKEFQRYRRALVHSSSSNYLSSLPTEKLLVFGTTWNVGNTQPPDDLTAWIPRGVHVVVVATQECSYGVDESHEDNKSDGDWTRLLQNHLGDGFALVAKKSMMEIRLHVFAVHAVAEHVHDVKLMSKATGLAHVIGNKGGVVAGMYIKDTSVCFVSSHLAAHQDMTQRRNDDVHNIILGTRDPQTDVDIVAGYDHVVWLGDLNYRLDFGSQGDKRTPSPEDHAAMLEVLGRGRYRELWELDQLAKAMDTGDVFLGFKAEPCDFLPTFKVAKGVAGVQYVTQRSPAWCDRVLWNSAVDGLALEEQGAIDAIATSDHKPVYSIFSLDVREFPPAHDAAYVAAALVITGMQGVALPVGDVGGTSDPYVVFTAPFVRKHKVKTGVVQKTLNPTWPDKDVPKVVLEVTNPARLRLHRLNFVVYDWDRAAANDYLCNGTLKLEEVVDAAGEVVVFGVELYRGGRRAGSLSGKMRLETVASSLRV